jgi:hypothetical protein
MAGIEKPLADRLWALHCGRPHFSTASLFPAGKAPRKGWAPHQIGLHAALKYHEFKEREPLVAWFQAQEDEWMFDEILAVAVEPYYLLAVGNALREAKWRADDEVTRLALRWLGKWRRLVGLHTDDSGVSHAPGWGGSAGAGYRDIAYRLLSARDLPFGLARKVDAVPTPHYRGVRALLDAGVLPHHVPPVPLEDIALRAPLCVVEGDSFYVSWFPVVDARRAATVAVGAFHEDDGTYRAEITWPGAHRMTYTTHSGEQLQSRRGQTTKSLYVGKLLDGKRPRIIGGPP